MKLAILLIIPAVFLGLATPAVAAETRCGWLANLTPQDLWLVDKQATWSITSQMQASGPDARGVDKVPPFDRKQFIQQGAGYGYGCACLHVETSAKDKRIIRVLTGTVRPLRQCQRDPALPPPSKW